MRALHRLFLFAILPLAFFPACKKKVTCGDGTHEIDGQCVILNGDGDGSLGGAGGEAPMEQGFPGIPVERWEDARTLLAEFEGAKAAGPASSTNALVAWDLPSVSDVEFNIYISTSDDNFSFGKPQFTAPAGAESALLTDLGKNEVHFIVVRLVLAGVELEPEEDNVVEVELAADTAPPTFGGVQDAETAPGAGVTLSWDAAEDTLSPDGVITYLVYYGTEEGEVSLLSPVAVSSPGATSTTVRMPAPDAEYFFIVRARDAAGNLDDNEVEIAAMSGPDVSAPVFGGCGNVAVRNASSFDVFWTPAVDDIASSAEISYNLYASTEPNGHNFSQPNDVIIGGDRGVVTGLNKDTVYYIVCRAMDPSGNEEKNTRTQFDRTKDDDIPPVFGGITAVENLNAETVDLLWDPATDNQSLEADIRYRVFLSDIEDGHDFENDVPWVTTEKGATSVTLQDLSSQTDYYIVVLAVDEGNNQSEPEPSTAITTLVSFRNDIEVPIFGQKCATPSCHEGTSPQANQNLSPGVAYNQIVGVPAFSFPSQDRIKPGQPNISHLYLRITTPPDGYAKMPGGDDVLSVTEIQTIETWILQGALKN